jgi:hypothetical protein
MEGWGVGDGWFEDILIYKTKNLVSSSQKTLHLYYKDQKPAASLSQYCLVGTVNPR